MQTAAAISRGDEPLFGAHGKRAMLLAREAMNLTFKTRASLLFNFHDLGLAL
jgi:hypothetical protein